MRRRLTLRSQAAIRDAARGGAPERLKTELTRNQCTQRAAALHKQILDEVARQGGEDPDEVEQKFRAVQATASKAMKEMDNTSKMIKVCHWSSRMW